ncbi:FERM ARHGEF and pleckstrin domain-containing protein 1 [Taenia solium]|eukprot:TsM_001051400 transcript=TsM_001051400 gene=TsM_001051400
MRLRDPGIFKTLEEVPTTRIVEVDDLFSFLEITSLASSSQGVGKVLHRATTSVHVCWHRSSTFSMSDILRANEYQTSGYLLRKFKNSNGWQKLWVVFTQLCLFFHKSYQDTFPLASLPLLGYSIITPSPEDNIRKEFVFKLQFKNHVYFFRDDSQTSFERWFDCLSSAAGTNARQRLVTSRHPVTSTVATAMTTTTATTITTTIMSNTSSENKEKYIRATGAGNVAIKAYFLSILTLSDLGMEII